MNLCSQLRFLMFMRVILVVSFALATAILSVPSAIAQQRTLDSIAVPAWSWPAGSPIPVCWISAEGDYATEKAWVQSAIQASWEAQTPVDFSGWQSCSQNGQSIRIAIEDSRPRSFVGRNSPAAGPTMWLNFTFSNGSFGTSCGRNETVRQNCIRSIAVHEFGHAIGLLHEQDRRDTPSWCSDQLGADDIDFGTADRWGYYVGNWDPDSVMNYCDGRSHSQPPVLSQGDVVGAWFLYGPDRNFLECTVNGARNNSCCSHLSPSDRENFAACTQWPDIPDSERLGYFNLCNATTQRVRCCDHLTAELQRDHAPAQCPDWPRFIKN